jgi:predicted RNase H-like HicB family nuclease
MSKLADMQDFDELDAISITLEGKQRADGSFFVTSSELPFFSAVGHDEQDALDNTIKILGPYLEANIPDYVDFKRVRDASDVLYGEEDHKLFPAHMIAMRGGHIEC